jgi:hypothetical protein
MLDKAERRAPRAKIAESFFRDDLAFLRLVIGTVGDGKVKERAQALERAFVTGVRWSPMTPAQWRWFERWMPGPKVGDEVTIEGVWLEPDEWGHPIARGGDGQLYKWAKGQTWGPVGEQVRKRGKIGGKTWHRGERCSWVGEKSETKRTSRFGHYK